MSNQNIGTYLAAREADSVEMVVENQLYGDLEKKAVGERNYIITNFSGGEIKKILSE